MAKQGGRGLDGRRPGDSPPVLDEARYLGRRSILRALGVGGALAATGPRVLAQDPGKGPVDGPGEGVLDPETDYPISRVWGPPWEPAGGRDLYPARRNPAFAGGRPITPEDTAARHNNYYEFLPGRAGPVYRYTEAFEARPWSVRIEGEVEEARDVDLDDIAKIAPLEERIYRLRCVEAWSMVVPWTGIPMKSFVEWCRPTAKAKFVRFTSFDKPDQSPGVRQSPQYPWPYYEGLYLDEAMHPLTMLVTGIYGHGLPAQHGAPLRVIVPWKYGYKSPKGIAKVKFLEHRPGTFWSELHPEEYPFLSNVEPHVPHPRWSQATERDLQTGDRIRTLPYNGYAEEVAGLYGTRR